MPVTRGVCVCVCIFARCGSNYRNRHNPPVGQRLWQGTGSSFLGRLRQLLKEVQVPGAEAYTYTSKAYRAGHATVLAREEASWAALQSAGGWRGKSPLSYVDASASEPGAGAPGG